MQMLLKHKRFWIAVGLAFVLLVIYLSVTPRPLNVPKWGGLNIGHMLAYGWLMFWFSQVFRRPGQRVAVFAAFWAMGIGLEYIQGMIGRDFSYLDMRDDGIGLVIGAILAMTPLGNSLAMIEAWLKA